MAAILAGVMPAPETQIELREFPEPDLAPGAVLLHTTFSEVCGTDVHLWHGRLEGVPYPIIPGHVSVGEIASIRGSVTALDGSALREGDRAVFFDVHRTCGRCYACTIARMPNRCPARRVYGITDSADEGLFGGWAEAIYLEPGVQIARLPTGVEPEDYIGAGCGLLTAVHALERARLQMGDALLVQGAGPVGLSVIALARLSGAGPIVVLGAPDDRLSLARRMGASAVLDIRTTARDERRAVVHDATGGRGVDVGVEAAGSARAFEEGLDLVRDGGVYVIAGHYTDAGPSTINVHRQINRKHLDVRGCWGSDVGHFSRALATLEAHARTIPWREIGARVYPLARAGDALDAAEAQRVPKAIIAPRA